MRKCYGCTFHPRSREMNMEREAQNPFDHKLFELGTS